MEKVDINTTNNHEIQNGEEIASAAPINPQNNASMGVFARLIALIGEMRPKQWTKNGAVFIGLVFASELLHVIPLERAILGFIAFCLISSVTYILNDLMDLEKDRQHPVKRFRPLASGRLPISWAVGAMVVLLLLCAGIISALFVLPRNSTMYASFGGANVLFALSVGVYLLLQICYSTWLKHIVLIDVFCIALGFVIRIIAGTVVVPVVISPWLYVVTCFLSLFLAFGKRRHELILLQGQASSHRKILKEYSIPMLDQMITVVVACTLMAYSLYTIQSPTGDHRLMITIPFVLYGMFRYIYLVYMRMEGGSPDEVLLRDRHVLGAVVLCTVAVVGALYWPA